MFYQYRPLKSGEFIVAGGDCSQGGDDYNVTQFVSKTQLDVPIVYRSRGVAAQMTGVLVPALEYIYDKTGIVPVIGLERNNGGASEMERLSGLNRNQKYSLYVSKTIGTTDPKDTNKYGYTTNTATRPKMLGDLKDAIDQQLLRIYDKATVSELFSFVLKNGKPEAEVGSHDDTIMALAIAWQMYQTENPPVSHSFVEFPNDEGMFEGGYY